MPGSERTSPHVLPRRDLSAVRRNRVFQALFSIPITNAKSRRQDLALPFDAVCVQFVEELAEKVLQDQSGTLDRFLEENPWPAELVDLTLSKQERAKVIVLNAIKQWLAKEAAYLDTLFTGGQFRKKLRSLAGGRNCPNCNRPFLEAEKIEFHHTVRDGRPPVPLCSDCHRRLERKTGRSPSTDHASGPLSEVLRIRKKTNSSWTNLQKATRSLLRKPQAPFGTKNVENSSKSIVRRMLRETGLDLPALQCIIEQCLNHEGQ